VTVLNWLISMIRWTWAVSRVVSPKLPLVMRMMVTPPASAFPLCLRVLIVRRYLRQPDLRGRTVSRTPLRGT
jgi:hypothetical protein